MDSQGRPLPVSKKLSKAISSVPRSRFQKPRPNLPGSKRSDSGSAPVSARKVVETSQSKDDINASVKINETETSKTKDDINTSSKTNDTPESKDDIDTNVKTDVFETKDSPDELLSVQELPQTEKEENNVIKNIDEIPVVESEENNVTSLNELLHDNELSNSHIPSAHESPQVEKDATVLQTEKIAEENENSTAFNSSETVQDKEINKRSSTSASRSESLPKALEQEKNDSNIQPSGTSTDRSSKYPHLTSILLKKRSEPKKEVQHKRRKKFKKGDAAPERSTMTMADLIYWNPAKSDEPRNLSSTVNASTVQPVPINNEEEECVDGGEAEENNMVESVPKLIISEDGQINIDQSSLIVSRNVPQPISTVVVKEEATYSSYRKRPLTKHWTPKDTTIFYKALSLVGTDFALMEQIFPHRTRRELKQKFKREEKFNIDLVNRAMYESHLTFDADTLEELIEHLNTISDDANAENVDDPDTPEKAKKRSSKKQKRTKKSKSADTEVSDSATECLTDKVTDTNKTGNKRKRRKKQLPEDDDDSNDDTESTIEMASGETEINGVNKKEEKTKVPEDILMSDDIENLMELVTEGTEDRVINKNNKKEISKKRKRKTKLPDEFVCDDEMEFITKVTESSAVSERQNNKRRRKPKELPSDFVDTDVIEACEVTNNDEFVEVTFNNITEDRQSEEDELNSCIPIENEDLTASADSALSGSVMAYEVVTSQIPQPKRKTHTSKLKSNQTPYPVMLSPNNYTPS